MVSTKEVRKGLYAKLNVAPVTSLLAAGSASLFHSVAPEGAAYPMLVYNKQAGTSTHTLGALAYDSHLWLVKGIVKGAPTSASPAEDIAAAIAAALDFQTLTVSGGTNLYLARESDVDYTETDGDMQYRHSGGIYRIVVS